MSLERVYKALRAIRESLDSIRVELNAEIHRGILDPEVESELQAELSDVRQDLADFGKKIPKG